MKVSSTLLKTRNQWDVPASLCILSICFKGYQTRGGEKTSWFLGSSIHGVFRQRKRGKKPLKLALDANPLFMSDKDSCLKRRLLWRFSSESFWRWRKLTGMHLQRRRSVQWCKGLCRTPVSWFTEDMRHNFTSLLTVASSMEQRDVCSPLRIQDWFT